jgi:polysaccharide export outer membrane protein
MFIFLFIIISGDVFLIPNDAIEISIWRQEDVSGRYLVDADTSLNIPLLGRFSIKNLPVDSLHQILVDKYHNYYGEIFLKINFYYRINIFGEVKSPGYYYLKSEDNLTNLLAQAGGPNERRNLGKIKILGSEGERIVNLEKTLKSNKNLEKLKLRPGDVVIIPRRFFSSLQEWSVLFTLGTLFLQIYNTVR